MCKKKQIEKAIPADEVIQALKCCASEEDNCHRCPFMGVGGISDICITAMSRAALDLIYRKQSGGEWVSVEEKNPEDVYGKDREKITVLVCTKSGKVSASTRCARYSYDYGQNTWVRTGEYEWSGNKKVTHWQPMPDPPHQQDDRQERIRRAIDLDFCESGANRKLRIFISKDLFDALRRECVIAKSPKDVATAAFFGHDLEIVDGVNRLYLARKI